MIYPFKFNANETLFYKRRALYPNSPVLQDIAEQNVPLLIVVFDGCS